MIELLKPFVYEMSSPGGHATAWHASLPNEVPLVQARLGGIYLEGAELRRAALDLACGVAPAIDSIQRQMVEGDRDRRLLERTPIEEAARLPAIAPIGVEAEPWRQLSRAFDPDLHSVVQEEARARVEEYAQREPGGFARLMEAASAHDRAVEGVAVRALANEDSRVFAAAARTYWSRFFGRPRPLPALPRRAAAWALRGPFEPVQVGALLVVLGLAPESARGPLDEEAAQTTLRKLADGDQRFWRLRAAGAGRENADELALEVVTAVGELVALQRDSAAKLWERAALLRKARWEEPGKPDAEPSA